MKEDQTADEVAQTKESEESAPVPESAPVDPETGEVIDIDLNDPAAEDAAVKIQVKRPSITQNVL